MHAEHQEQEQKTSNRKSGMCAHWSLHRQHKGLPAAWGAHNPMGFGFTTLRQNVKQISSTMLNVSNLQAQDIPH